MVSYNSNLKTWGSQGEVFPDGYNYIQGEQPVDAWDNYFAYQTIEDLFHLINLTNKRLETDSGSSHPTTPEPGHLSHRTDGVVTTDEEIFFYDGSNSTWHRLMQADGDKMTGELDTGGYKIVDSGGDVTLGDPLEVDGARLDHDWYEKQEGGTVANNSAVPIGTMELNDGQTLYVTRAMLTEDGFTTPAKSGTGLYLVPDGSANSTILSGDGATLYPDESNNPIVKYQNTTGAPQVVGIMLDNGQYGTGVGSSTQLYGGFTARKV